MSRAPFQVLVLPFRRSGTALEVAVFHRRTIKFWQFISGGGENDESPEAAAVREGFEEAQIPTSLRYPRLDSTATIPAAWFPAWREWPHDVLVAVEHAFAVDVGTHTLVLSDEHDEVRWVHYDDAMKLLTFDSNKCALWELHERLFPSARGSGSVEHDHHCGCTPRPATGSAR